MDRSRDFDTRKEAVKHAESQGYSVARVGAQTVASIYANESFTCYVLELNDNEG